MIKLTDIPVEKTGMRKAQMRNIKWIVKKSVTSKVTDFLTFISLFISLFIPFD